MRRLVLLLLATAVVVPIPSLAVTAPSVGRVSHSGHRITLTLPGVAAPIVLNSFQWGVSRAGRGLFVMRKTGGESAAALACAAGKHYSSAILHDGTKVTYVLTNVTFGIHYPVPTTAGRSAEITFEFTFTKFFERYSS